MNQFGTFSALEARRIESGACFVVLIDPDKLPLDRMPAFVESCADSGVDVFFVGGSLLHASDYESYVTALRKATALPIVGFPGSVNQISAHLDAILFLSIISGRNPEYLFGQHVQAAPVVRRAGIEPIGTGYMLVESGITTTAQYISMTSPIPRHKPEIAAATGLAAEMLGMKLLYLDAGSGADMAVPSEMIQAVSETCSLPLVVGGGMRTPEDVSVATASGAGYLVVGTALERRNDPQFISEMVAASRLKLPEGV